jgi:uncharacterized protein (DUF2062 family)
MRITEYLKVLRERIVKEPLPPERVACGWALGMFIGCSIPFGFQLALSIPLAIVMRVSKVGATLATLITNPVTIFFIYPAQTYIVNRFLFNGMLSYDKLKNIEWTWQAVCHLGVEAVASFFLGGFFLALIMTPITYLVVKNIVLKYRSVASGSKK